MRALFDSGYRGHDLYILNMSRLQCQAITLTDITAGDGRYIRKTSWNSEPDIVQAFQRDWPRSVPQLPREWISLWRRGITNAFGQRIVNDRLVLDTQLGGWINTHQDHWNLWWYEECLFWSQDDLWKVYTPTTRTRRGNKFQFSHWTNELPEESQRATGEVMGSLIAHTGNFEQLDKPFQKPSDTFQARRQLRREER